MDVGAYRGSFTDAALAYWRPARIWLVEAHPECAAALRQKYRQHPNCKVINCAIASVSGEVELRVNESLGSSSLLPIRPESAAVFGQPLAEREQIRVPAQSLDALFDAERIEQVDLMKVDIQGAESQLIQGGQNALQRVQQVYIEVTFVEQYSGSATFPELFELLRGSGFKLRSFSQGRLGADGTLAYADALFIRPAARGGASGGGAPSFGCSPRG
jgi:FkbM family methyltransferase